MRPQPLFCFLLSQLLRQCVKTVHFFEQPIFADIEWLICKTIKNLVVHCIFKLITSRNQ